MEGEVPEGGRKFTNAASQIFACSPKMMLSLNVHPQDYVPAGRITEISATTKATSLVGKREGGSRENLRGTNRAQAIFDLLLATALC
jgi:hypothetical protein